MENKIKSNVSGYGLVFKNVMQNENIDIEAKALYSYLSSYAGSETKSFPGVSLICHDLKISEKRFKKYRKQLEDEGVIVVERKRTDNGFSKNIYTINHYVVSGQFVPVQFVPVQSVPVQNDPTKNNSIKNNSIKNNNIKTNSRRLDEFSTNKENSIPNLNHTTDDDAYFKIFERLNQYEINPNNVLVNSLSKKSNQIDLAIILWAIDTAYNNGIKRPNNYINAIVDRKIQQGVITIEKHQQQEKERQVKNSKPNQFMTESEKQERIKVAQQISSNPNAIDELNNQPLNNSENPFSQFDMD